MRRVLILVASAAINAYAIPAVAAERTSIRDIDAARAGAVTVHSQPTNAAADKEKTCRDYAASFYESVVLRHAAANRADGAQVLAALDSVINAFNDLLATKCSS
jgi:CHAT domain-containing protein